MSLFDALAKQLVLPFSTKESEGRILTIPGTKIKFLFRVYDHSDNTCYLQIYKMPEDVKYIHGFIKGSDDNVVCKWDEEGECQWVNLAQTDLAIVYKNKKVKKLSIQDGREGFIVDLQDPKPKFWHQKVKFVNSKKRAFKIEEYRINDGVFEYRDFDGNWQQEENLKAAE